MTNGQKNTAFCRMTAISVFCLLMLLMLFAGSSTAYAAEYDLYIGSTRVTSENAGNIFGENGSNGEPTARYDVSTNTLYLNGVHIDKDHYHEVRKNNEEYPEQPIARYSLFAGENTVRHLVITGNNSFDSEGVAVYYYYKDGSEFVPDDILPSETGMSGICFISTWGGSDDKSFTITGDGTLTSTSTKGTAYDYNLSDGSHIDGSVREANLGTGMTIQGRNNVYIGNKDGTGPTLNLTGWNTGADFYDTGKFAMQGGTVTAKALSSEAGTGVYLSDATSVFDGGTIAGYGIAPNDEGDYGPFSYATGISFNTTISKTHMMQRVYPETVENDSTNPIDHRKINIRELSGWCVVGMTADEYKKSTDAVLKELGLDGSGGGTEPSNPDHPGEDDGKSGSYHTDALPDSDTEIDVQGFTRDGKVYSVDVEWGAMTFQYENTSWDAEEHKTKEGRGWLIYDNVHGKALADKQADINRITVTNHSNAEVYATLSFAGTDSYTDVTGEFTANADDADTDFTAAAGSAPAYLALATADNNKGAEEGQGKETAGTAYFLPNGISKTGNTADDITRWTKIGRITVGLLTEEP